jgi:putative AbiEii toxin of type IV toxin-antitoxin system
MEIAGGAFLGTNRYGPVQANFSLTLPSTGYQVLVGPNNYGKSSILQFIFVWAFRAAQSEIGADRVALLLPDRDFVNPTTQTAGRTLVAWNSDLVNQISGAPLTYDAPRGPARNELLSLLVNHKDFLAQMNRLLGFLDILGLPKPVLGGNQQINFENIVVYVQGSGLRSLLTMLASLTSPELKLICIDEPELSLEPRVQKALRDLLILEAKDRLIVVATHSHLFLNRQDHAANHIVGRAANGDVTVNRVNSEEQLFDIAFQLLGNDTEDLFFPGNYLVVEGASDQVVCEATLRLLGVPKTRVKVLSSGGITNVEPTLNAVLNSLKPLVPHDSPYSRRVVALIDKPTDKGSEQLAKLKTLLSDRFFQLDSASLEEYVPASLFEKANRQRAADLEQITRLRASGNHTELGEFKRAVSNAIAQALTLDDLQLVPVIRAAAERAANWEGR